MQAAIFNKSYMKKHITALLAFIGILIFIVACSNPDEKETNPLIGYWYTAYNDRAVSLRIDENGTGEATFYIYNGEKWEKSDTPAYGHWAMLRRTGKAQEICGCEEHELLLPIPKDELIYNRNLTQNPGY